MLLAYQSVILLPDQQRRSRCETETKLDGHSTQVPRALHMKSGLALGELDLPVRWQSGPAALTWQR